MLLQPPPGRRRVGDGLVVTARSEDGVIEAVELPGRAFAVGVQWHPEETGDVRLFADWSPRPAPRRSGRSGWRIDGEPAIPDELTSPRS